MKKIYFILSSLSLIILAACGTNSQTTDKTETAGTSGIDATENPEVRLTTKQVEKIKEFHAAFEEVYDFTLEETLNNFRGEANVDGEIDIWLYMAGAYKNYLDSQPENPGIKVKKEAYKLILLRSMMSAEETLQNARLKILSEDEAKEVLSYYKEKPDPLDSF